MINEVIARYNNKACSYDGLVEDIGQCIQLVCCYWRDFQNFRCPPIPAAKDLWTNPTVLANFDKIAVGQEQPGDVAVWGASSLIDSPEYGHTDIVISKSTGGFVGLDSNYESVNNAQGQPVAHEVTHTYSDVLGFLRRKNMSAQALTPEEADELYLVAFNRHIDPAGLKETVGKTLISQGERLRKSAEYKKGRKAS